MTTNDNPTLNEPFNAAHFESLPHAACVSLFHRTGRTGCGTYSRDVMTGRLLDWTSVVDTNDADGQADQANRRASSTGTTKVPPYVAVMEEAYYTAENIAQLVYFASQYEAGDDYGTVEEGGPLRGVLVLASSSNTTSSSNIQQSSPEPLSPQGDDTASASLTIGSSYEWNANNAGDGLTNTDMYGLPTAYVADSNTADYLRGTASEQSAALGSSGTTSVSSGNVDATVYPSIVSEFNYYMGPGGDVDADGNAIYNSKKCLEWKDNDGEWSPRCAPLGGNSVWSVAGSPLSLGYAGENANADNDGDENEGENDGDNNNNDRPVILLSTSIDSTSMFHDLSPGANNAASNILTLLLTAQLIGSTVTDEVLDGLYGQIAFSFFQGESYGYIGSRRFLKDVLEGFQCTEGDEGVASVYKRKDEANVARACLHPLRADLTFQNLGQVRGMIAVDQVGNLGGSKNLYVQGGDATDGENGFAGFLSEVMVELSANDDGGYTAQASSVNNDDDDGTVPLPPTPLSSLVQLSSSAVGGVVLTGYDDAFVANSLYHSHLDSASSKFQTIDKDAIASAATLLARSAIAAAYQNADEDVDSATAAAYALELLPDPVSSSSSTFGELYNCLFEDGNCETFLNYGAVERSNDAVRTGSDLGMGVPLGTPPGYYTSIFDSSNGQGFVRVGGGSSGRYYGSLVADGKTTDTNGEVIKQYGEDQSDTFLVRPSLLEMSIFGLLNEFLGRGSYVANEDGGTPTLATCKNSDDCSSVSYCNSESSSSVLVPTCAGGSCICGSRSHYHPALDEALSAVKNVGPGMFELQDGEEGISALYTEPYWSNYVGVRVYNDAGNTPGVFASSIGAVFALGCIGFVLRLKKTMVKEKVY
eukprot:CAMPEP_0201866898 /NCGR_PEP_ID=MMETSP0902-20130614/1321_1 /ASSEMBLY_ACC=CAM_ASM_000551 /TAXON_ID=420261 /ORGANISM="Thalassiosira antarctica, Strain CCMP982" /LENGTH=872 /DNA_ID=CAMNT_0048391945 /DNA_START=21 /DNA_END=2639 /DNA_ORIENTATION=+